ncbi:MAG: alanine--tRNA ligase, partial [Rickettsiales bacterium]|nr:alanine--tRNA ligase [Rickettsiales bacterium]
MFTLDKIRKTFLDFFVERDHTLVPSSPLVPDNDQSLLFTNSGMVQFKDVFTGKETRPYARACSVQKSIRINGKHDDLDNVGYDGRHHTFFEMLGNWSFGDYFKEKAILYSWELLTKVFGLAKDRLYFTVYPTDSESREWWKKIAGASDDRIIDIEGNLWAMGDVGPNGFDTEIFYDQGPGVQGGPPGSKDEDGDRYLEIWNNVFMQFETFPDGRTEEMTKKSVDTGMGLERMAAVMQGVSSNFDLDLFRAIISDIEQAIGVKKTPENEVSFNVMADHIRAASFLIADGVLPSNEGRGYVLRRIMRRALRHLHMLGVKQPAMFKMADSLRGQMARAYPELDQRAPLIRQTILTEEENFGATLSSGLKVLNDAIAGMQGKVLSGEEAFRLYDTYGFPLDLTADILRGQGMSVDADGFESAMARQRERSRARGNFKGEAGDDKIWYDLRAKFGETRFLGYDALDAQGRITAIHGDLVITDQTPFYAESGGQAADKGFIAGIEVVDVQRIQGIVAHRVAFAGSLATGQTVEMSVDKGFRDAVSRNQSAAHLLQAALREAVGEHTAQRGSWIGQDEFRFDFTSPKPLTQEQVFAIERIANARIAQDLAITMTPTPIEEARKSGAIAIFGEKYGEIVRVVRMGAASIEFCGGTHRESTGDIKFFKITKEESIAAGTRRITAKAGEAALACARELGLDTSLPADKLIIEAQRAGAAIAEQKAADERAARAAKKLA